MSFSIYSEIIAIREDEAKIEFKNFAELREFFESRELLLYGKSLGGDVFGRLNKYAQKYDLPTLLDLHKPDQAEPFPDCSVHYKYVKPDQLDRLRDDIDKLLSVVKENPGSLIADDYSYPGLMGDAIEEVSEAANSDLISSDLGGYCEGEEVFYFFAFLQTLRKICADAKKQNHVVMHVLSQS